MNMNLERVVRILKSDKDQRSQICYKMLSRAARANGWRLHSNRFSPWNDPAYLEILTSGGFAFNDKKYSIYQLARGVSSLDGDTAECGVYKGQGSWLILHADPRSRSRHHVFDSFDGVSEPLFGVDSSNEPNMHQWQKHDMAVSLESVQTRLSQFSNVSYYEGWIPDRFADVSDRIFKFVHIDVDLYEPTLASFQFFYDRMEVGGVILCDDYACPGTPGALKAVDEFLADKPETAIINVSGSGFIIKQ